MTEVEAPHAMYGVPPGQDFQFSGASWLAAGQVDGREHHFGKGPARSNVGSHALFPPLLGFHVDVVAYEKETATGPFSRDQSSRNHILNEV